jgi:hypothetical protein
MNAPLRAAALASCVIVPSLHQFALEPDEPAGVEAARVGLAYGLGWAC